MVLPARLLMLCSATLAMAATLAACGSATPAADDGDGFPRDAVLLSDAVTETDGQFADLADVATDVAAPDIQAQCLEALPNPVGFDPTKVGSGAMRKISLHNCGLQGLCVTGIELQNQSAYLGEYTLTMNGLAPLCPGIDATKGPSTNQPCCLGPDAQVGLELYFTPKSASSAKKTAQIWAKYLGTKTIVLLEGMATP